MVLHCRAYYSFGLFYFYSIVLLHLVLHHSLEIHNIFHKIGGSTRIYFQDVECLHVYGTLIQHSLKILKFRSKLCKKSALLISDILIALLIVLGLNVTRYFSPRLAITIWLKFLTSGQILIM